MGDLGIDVTYALSLQSKGKIEVLTGGFSLKGKINSIPYGHENSIVQILSKTIINSIRILSYALKGRRKMLGVAMHTTIKTLWEKNKNKTEIACLTGHD